MSLRITFVLVGYDLSGGQRVVAQLADRLRKRGHDVFVVAPATRPIPTQIRLRSLLRGRGWPSHPKSSLTHFDPLGVPHHTLDRWRPVVDADVPDADVVVATWWETAEWVARLSPSKGAKAFFIQHHETHRQPLERVEAVWRLPLHKITIARWLVDLARDRYGDGDVSIVPISYDRDVFHAEPRGKQAAPTVGLIYSVARLKGTEVSLRAIARLAERFPGLRVLTFGTAPLVGRLPLPPYATFEQAPPQDRIRAIYSSCDVWLSGSRAEGFLIPPLEAMACRCPVVSTRVSGPLDYIEEGVNGHLVDIEDDAALADRAARILTLPDPEWRAMSEAAHRTAQGYDWDEATRRFEDALRTAIDRSARRQVAPE